MESTCVAFQHKVRDAHRLASHGQVAKLLVSRVGVRGSDRIIGSAGAAIDATFGVDIKLGCLLELGLVFLGMNAVGGTDFHAKFVLNAGVGDYISHESFS